MQFLLYAAEGALLDYYVWSLGLDHIGHRILFRFSSAFVNILSHSGFYKITEGIRMGPILETLTLRRLIEVAWFSLGSFDEFVYDFQMSLRTILPQERCVATRLRDSFR